MRLNLVFSAALAVVLHVPLAEAEMVAGDVFLRGDRLEVGLGASGALGTAETAPAGFHATNGVLGLVADTQADGWSEGSPAQSGDYLAAALGEGWAVKWAGTLRANAAGQPAGVPQAVLVETSSGNELSAVWEGTATGTEGESLQILQTVSLGVSGTVLRIHVQLVNTGAQTLTGLKYLRGFNPDPDVPLGGSPSTANAVWLQPSPGSLGHALVVATSGLGQAFALATADPRAVASVEAALPMDPDEVLGSPNAPAPEDASTGDETLALAFDLEDLRPGESTSLELAYATDPDFYSELPFEMGSVRVIAPTAGVSGASATMLVAADPSETNWIELYQNGTLLAVDADPEPGGVYGVAFQPAPAPGTDYVTLDAVAYLVTGSWVTERVSLPLSNEGPVALISAPERGQNVGNGGGLRVEAGDAGDPPTRVDVFLDSPGAHDLLVSCTEFPCDAALTGLPADETVAIRARAVDALGTPAYAEVVVSTAANEAPGALLLAPNSGYLWAGSLVNVRWGAWDDTLVKTIDVGYSTDGGGAWTAIPGCSGLQGTVTSCSWTPSAEAVSNTVQVRVVATDPNGVAGSDASDAVLKVLPAGLIAFTAPKATVSWRIGTLQKLAWTHNLGAGSRVRIELNRAYPEGAWETLADDWPNTSATKGSFAWTVAGPATSRARFRITDVAASGNTGIAPANVTLADPSVTVGEVKTWIVGRSYAIRFTHNLGKGQPVRIELQRGGVWETLFASVNTTAAASSAHTWTVAGPTTTAARLRVTWLAGVASDESNAPFTIK